MSLYLNPLNSLQRLRDDWAKHKSLIIAVDFDSTLFPYFPKEKAADFEPIRDLVRNLKMIGCKIIIFTASEESRWDDIKLELKHMHIEWDYFNQSPPYIPNVGSSGKVYANAYLDDRAGLYEVFTTLNQFLMEVQYKKIYDSLGSLSRQLSRP